MTYTVATKENDVWTTRKTFTNSSDAKTYSSWYAEFYNESTKIIEF
jgi:hypothetical protein